MNKQAAAVLALGAAGTIITCAFVAAFFLSNFGPLWAFAAFFSAGFTLSGLHKAATPAPAPAQDEPAAQTD